MRLRIGQFARLGQVSVSALRFYDEVDLLKPAHTDVWNGYRYYDLDQLPALNRILALKDLGLSLEEIGRLLGDELPAEQLRAMLHSKRAELQEQARELSERLARVEARFQQIEMEGKMPDYDVLVKRVAPIRAAILRDLMLGQTTRTKAATSTYLMNWSLTCGRTARPTVAPRWTCGMTCRETRRRR